LLETRDLEKRFAGLRAVNGASLRVEAGTITALISPNGSGKTTTFDLITGNVRPDAGTVRFEGRIVFGIGLGYREAEDETFGVARRGGAARMIEALHLVRRLWTEDEVTFAGRFFRVTKATCTIRPVQKPYPPIWIAANSAAREATGTCCRPSKARSQEYLARAARG